MASDIEFVIGVAGDRYQRLASVLLQSIFEVYGRDARVIVVWQDVDDAWPDKVTRLLSNSKLVEMVPPLRPKHPLDMIPLNLQAWTKGAEYCEGQRIAFMDVDMLLVKPIGQYFGHANITYTYKTREAENLDWMLNAGIILSSMDEYRSRAFMAEWLRRVQLVMADNEQLSKACSGWGSADQAVLGWWLDTKDYDRLISRDSYSMMGVPCAELNEVVCGPLGSPTCVIHYKGFWHPILLDGKRNEKWRPMSLCDEQYQLWKETNERWNQG